MGFFDRITNGVSAIVDFFEPQKTEPVRYMGPSGDDYSEPVQPEPAAGRKYKNSGETAFKPVIRRYRTESGGTFTPLWQKAGWMVNVHDSNLYIGTFRFFDKRRQEDLGWEGAIQAGPYEMKVFIKHPPVALQNHKHWQCFNHQGDGWYLVHFLYDLNGLDDAILNVQRLIAEAYWFC